METQVRCYRIRGSHVTTTPKTHPLSSLVLLTNIKSLEGMRASSILPNKLDFQVGKHF